MPYYIVNYVLQMIIYVVSYIGIYVWYSIKKEEGKYEKYHRTDTQSTN